MKTLFVALFMLTTGFTTIAAQDTTDLVATFDFYEDNTYYFVDKEGYTITFTQIADDVDYDLTSEDFVGKVFTISYYSDTEIDALDEEIAVNTITALKLLKDSKI